MTLETDWLDVDILHPAHIVAPYTLEEIDMLPGKTGSRVWATILDVREQAYEIGHIDGFHNASHEYNLVKDT